MSWQQQVFGPMAERTMENAQRRHLVYRYDLSRDSRLAAAIVAQVNRVLDQEERRRGVQRVRPGELLLRTRHGPLVLPLRLPEDLGRVLAGERFGGRAPRHPRPLRGGLPGGCSPRPPPSRPPGSCAVSGLAAAPAAGSRAPSTPPAPSGPGRPSRPTPGVARAGPAGTRPACHQPATYTRLVHYLGTQAGIPPAVQEALATELAAIRARCAPRITTLASGQLPLVAMHIDAGRSLWQQSRHQPMAPILLSVPADGEGRLLRHQPPATYQAFLELAGRRMARVLVEAYAQDGLLSYTELQWVFLASAETVSRALDHHQRTLGVVLPCPGTVLDMGRMLTHKRLIVRLHLQGHTVLEIARATWHHPRSVDAYLKAFDAVLILHLYGLPPHLIASVLGRGEPLVAEYLELIAAYLKDPETMRDHLRQRGIKIPAQISNKRLTGQLFTTSHGAWPTPASPTPPPVRAPAPGRPAWVGSPG